MASGSILTAFQTSRPGLGMSGSHSRRGINYGKRLDSEEGMPMRYLAALVVMLLLAGTATAAPLRDAKAGSRIGSLVVGLTRIPLDSGKCGMVPVERVGWVVPGRPRDEDHASFVGFLVHGRIAILASYDESNLDQAMVVYADLDGHDLITDVLPVEQAPSACWIVTRMLRWNQTAM
jgi:hypothetical protein